MGLHADRRVPVLQARGQSVETECGDRVWRQRVDAPPIAELRMGGPLSAAQLRSFAEEGVLVLTSFVDEATLQLWDAQMAEAQREIASLETKREVGAVSVSVKA